MPPVRRHQGGTAATGVALFKPTPFEFCFFFSRREDWPENGHGRPQEWSLGQRTSWKKRHASLWHEGCFFFVLELTPFGTHQGCLWHRSLSMLTSEEINDKVTKVLAESLDVEKDDLIPTATLHGDLGPESIDLLDIVFRLEGQFRNQNSPG